ncbi:dihydroneopterin aldolase [Azospirillum oryzae]|uniref:Dihydroneopterin aldolase n=2 Tax=Azospirillaceae TaxID=2829815 RepID=A0A1X7EKU0_9PROT|nr:dihydroneopterin aldolase [Azospirillum sp. INR13]QCG95823.1 dihydroneopterin aldolase [Azospirillum sp. TSA2s]SMF35644.1 dihydroneopterin aldolase [Azospirillum oryzae]
MDQIPGTRRMASAEPFAIRRHTLSLVDFELLASIGVHPFEKRNPQRLLISVSLTLDPAHQVRNDDIVTAVDYDFLRTGIRALIESRHYHLQETLVHDILVLCSGRPEITGAVVSSRKPDVYPDCASVGYEAAAEYRRAGA